MKCAYPGTFDPISNGHVDIIGRLARMFDEVHVVVGNNIFKKTLFTIDERLDMVKECVKHIPNVKVVSYDGLVVEYLKTNNITVLARGMRNYSDYENEFSLFQYNRDIYPQIETILLMPKTKLQVVSSSAIKELLTFGCDISKYVPRCILNRILDKFKN